MKILIVDDNKIKRELIKEDIENNVEKPIIDISDNIISAKEHLKEVTYDLLILDLNLPTFEGEECEKEAGIQLFKEISKSKLYKKPEDIVIMTEYDDLKEKYEDEIEKGLFNVIKFKSDEEEWKNKLNNKLKYRVEYKKSIGEEELGEEKLLFISHSSEDIDYVNEFVNLLEDIGFNSNKKLFCSSLSGYNIPTGKNIYDYLREQFNKQVYVVCLLSENYYSSPACMNEMGATWVKAKGYTAILLPEFGYNQLKGAIDASRIWFKISEKDRLNDFKEQLEKNFSINQIENTKWQRKLDEFIKKVEDISNKNRYKTKKEKVILEGITDNDNEDSIVCTLRFINNGNETKKCRKINLEVIDCNDRIISFEINQKILNQFTIYKNENRRETVVLDKKNIKNIDLFNIYDLKDYKIIDLWTSIF